MLSKESLQLAKYLGKDYLFGLARHYFCDRDTDDETAAVTQDLLRAASHLGHEEAIWMLNLWTKHRVAERFSTLDFQGPNKLFYEVFCDDDSSPSLAYRANYAEIEEAEFELAQRAALLGEPYGEYLFGTCLAVQGKKSEAVEYYWKAAAHGVGAAYSALALHYDRYDINDPKHPPIQLHLKAAQLGELGSIYDIARDYRSSSELSILGPDPVEAAKWRVRYAVFDGINLDNIEPIDSPEDVKVVFAMGRELDGCFELLPSLPISRSHDKVEEYVNFHRRISRAARRAALTVIVCFKALLSKDMRVLIAKLVYASRLEPTAWYNLSRN